jgi:hypothetical protein
MGVYQLNPLQDPRWQEFLLRHPDASMFHTPAWLEALRRVYGYEPVVLTTSEPGEPLKNGVVFCLVKSWFTGSRIVSLPFSDHCQPLVDDPADLRELLSFLRREAESRKWKFVELRPRTSLDGPLECLAGFTPSTSLCFHALDLRPNLEHLYRNFHGSSVRQRIKRAEREGLSIQAGRSDLLLRLFYRLLLLTRRRHQLPPQPLAWFRNLIDCFKEELVIRVAFKGKDPIASILTLSHKNTVVYKYGVSDSRRHNLGGMPFLIWAVIQQGKAAGLQEFDLGRSELDNSGLIAFKDNWGATRSQLTYYRYPQEHLKVSSQDWRLVVARKAFSTLPDFCLRAAGSILYKHVG